MLSLATMGAGVLHPRAIKYAKEHQIKLFIKSSFEKGMGTLVSVEKQSHSEIYVIGVAFKENIARISISEFEDGDSLQAKLMLELASRHIQADIYKQYFNNVLTVLIKEKDLQDVLSILHKEKNNLTYRNLEYENGLAKVSVVGRNITSHPGIKEKVCKVLLKNKVKVKLVGESSISVTAVVEKSEVYIAAERLHAGFGLDFIVTEQVHV
jgi:aspartate kinase